MDLSKLWKRSLSGSKIGIPVNENSILNPEQIIELIKNPNTTKTRSQIHNIYKGGMGVVYIVYDVETRKALAVKTYQDEIFASNPNISKYFEKESLAWINLDAHQNITRAYSVYTDNDDKPYIFLEYVDGGDLNSWIGKPYLTEDLEQALNFSIQFCDGIIHAYSKGIIAHRDIKPSNCLITGNRILKITDFGLVRFDDNNFAKTLYNKSIEKDKKEHFSLTNIGKAAGTPAYMAPEQFKNAKLTDIKSDIYSFGIMLYQIITGKLPFEEHTWDDFEFAHNTQTPPKILISSNVKQKNTLTKSLNEIVQKCLAKTPNARYKNFEEIREHLGDIYLNITGRTATQPPIGEELDLSEISNKGASLFSLGYVEQAIHCFDICLEKYPHESSFLVNKATALAKGFGKFKEALIYYDKALKNDPNNGIIWYRKALTYAKLNESPQVYAALKEAQKLGYKDAPYAILTFKKYESEKYYNDGVAFLDSKNPTEAISCFNQAIELNPDLAEAWSNKGEALRILGKKSEGLECIEFSLNLNSNNHQAWLNKGNALRENKKFEEAITCYNYALQINPYYAIAWFNKGAVKAEIGDINYAISCFVEAHALGYKEAENAITLCQQGLKNAGKQVYEYVALKGIKENIIENQEDRKWHNTGESCESFLLQLDIPFNGKPCPQKSTYLVYISHVHQEFCICTSCFHELRLSFQGSLIECIEKKDEYYYVINVSGF